MIGYSERRRRGMISMASGSLCRALARRVRHHVGAFRHLWPDFALPIEVHEFGAGDGRVGDAVREIDPAGSVMQYRGYDIDPMRDDVICRDVVARPDTGADIVICSLPLRVMNGSGERALHKSNGFVIVGYTLEPFDVPVSGAEVVSRWVPNFTPAKVWELVR